MSGEDATASEARTVFIVSDHTGLTAEAFGRSLLAQFEGLEFTLVVRPFIDTHEKIGTVVEEIECARRRTRLRPLVFSTLARREYWEVLQRTEAFTVDLFSAFLADLAAEIGRAPIGLVGRYHGLDGLKYQRRIDAVEFALATDDGLGLRRYAEADVLLTGVSRTGKTPSCLYLAMQYGLRAANYPLTDENFARDELPKALRPHRDRLFGLTIDPERLYQIRQGRRAGSRYASLDTCRSEVRWAERLFAREGLPTIDVTTASVEEITSGLARRLEKGRGAG